MIDPRKALADDNPMKQRPLYVKGAQTWSLDEAETSRCIIPDPLGNESLWVASSPDNKEMALLNQALAFAPFPSWGAVFPKTKHLNADPIRGEAPKDLMLTLHPEAWAEYIKKGVINEQGLFIGEVEDDDE